uniref:hypothetical protein n=1 Tax=Nonomuraea pusilla TaxID=46177 RepID=UPI00128F33D0|nr:hypothetical protein [Nonomuraea pusilla]
MANVSADEPSLPEAAKRPIADTIDYSGYSAAEIVRRSEGIARDFSPLAPGLVKYPLHQSCLSRWRHGKGRRLYREKLILLKLTVLCLADFRYKNWSDSEREAALDKAVAFAEQVLAAIAEGAAADGAGRSTIMTARHERTAELLGAYGELLLQQLSKSSTGEAEAKLALLHHLSGENDDARYWTDLAIQANPLYTPPSSPQEWFDLARSYAAEYQRAHDLKTARMYLDYAADRGDGEAAYQLGLMADLEGEKHKAMACYYRAADLGCPDGIKRAERLKAELTR